MKRSTWRILAFGALMGAVALPASAQVVIGGSGTPSVEVNWSVLDNLGRQPTLADMLKSGVPGAETRAELSQPKSKGVQYRPYQAGAKPYAKSAKAAPKPKKSHVVPASAKSERMADLVQSSSKPAPAAKVVEAPKPAAPAIIGPQISLPEVPKPMASAATAPVQLAKVEPTPAPAPKAEPKTETAPLPPTALTPPPMPAAPAKAEVAAAPAKAEVAAAPTKVEFVAAPAKVEVPVAPAKIEAPVEAKVEAPQQIASLPPTPAPAPVVSAKGGDTLSVPFAAESARLPDASRADLDRMVKRMQKDESLGLQLLAYAEGDDANASKARRLSLSRAVEMRKYLMEQGLRATRIEVRALGNKVEGGGPADRVDAVLVNR